MNRAVGIPRGEQRPLPRVEGDAGGGRTEVPAAVATVVQSIVQSTNKSVNTIFHQKQQKNQNKHSILSDEIS